MAKSRESLNESFLVVGYKKMGHQVLKLNWSVFSEEGIKYGSNWMRK